MSELQIDLRRMLAAATAVAVVALPCVAVAANGPPDGTPPGQAVGGPPGLTGAPPPGQAKKDVAAATQPAIAAPAPAQVAAPSTTTAAPAPAPAGSPGASKHAQAPGQLKKAARAAPVSARPAAAPVAATTAAVQPTPTSQAAAAPTAAATRRAKPKTTRRPHRAAAHRAASPATLPAVALAPVAATRSRAPAPAPLVHRTRTAKAHAHGAPKPQPANTITRTITRTVRDIAHVIPVWAKLAIAALGAALLLAGALLAAAALRHRRLRRERARLLEDVGVLQEALLPVIPATVGGLAVSVAYRPAAGLAAGGDFYDVFELEQGKTGIIVGDISGHGRDVLGSATFVRHMVRSYLEAGLTPRASIQLAGSVLDDQTRGDDFATIVAAVHDPAAGTLSYATAGHPPPIVAGPATFEPILVGSAPPAGSGVTTGTRQTTLALPPGSTVCFYTDGLSEARTGREQLGRDRLQFAVEELAPDASAAHLVDLIAHATEEMRDDVAVCLIRTGADAPAGTVRAEEIEVTMSDLRGDRLQRFFDACGVRPSDATAAVKAAAPHVAGYGSVLLRVRLAGGRSGVDVVPVARSMTGGEVIPVGSIR